ncbi:carbohydrate ABC transporter permease [Nakamurella lactea]|uniref:carbohydrate ABC transporter permease n=1 Tax=Nakamurella lactea TaxID=459515 RepID=UPI000427AF1F|nr:carbohydrate ABC transporter permease [Nakamurella lactea]
MTTSTVDAIPVIPGQTNANTPKPGGGRATSARIVKYVLLFIFLVIVLIPAYVMIVTSFKPGAEISASRSWQLPINWTGQGWSKAWDTLKAPMGRSLAIASVAAIISSMLGSMNGFVFAKWRFPGSNMVFTLFLFGMFLPYPAIMIPLQQLLINDIGLSQGVVTLMVVHTIFGIPICSLIFRNYYATAVPNEILEAARVDGAGMWKTYTSIVLPVSIPGFVVTLIWQFTSAWNDFLFALFLSNSTNGPATYALQQLSGGQNPDYASSMAGALISSLPTLVIYIVLGRYFISGMMSGSVK